MARSSRKYSIRRSDALEEGAVTAAIEDHLALERDIELIEQLGPSDARFDHIMARIIDTANQHMTHEERSLFPEVERRLPHLLPELSKQIVRRKEQLAGSVEEMEGRS